MDLLGDPNRADEITRRILSRQSVSEAEYRYIVMFNLAAMTQLLWELSTQRNQPSRLSGEVPALEQAYAPNLGRIGGFKTQRKRLLTLLASLASFLAGIGIGYLIP